MIHLDGIVFSLQRYGGISVYVNALTTELLAQGCNIKLAVPEGELLGSPSTKLANSTLRGPTRVLERYRDYHCNSPIGHSSYYRLPTTGAKSVITVYDFTYERYFPFHKKLIHSWQKNRAIRSADAVICISESTRKDLLHFVPGVSPGKVHVVPLGINEEFSANSPATTNNIAATSYPYFLYVGARSTYKNFLPVITALQNRQEHLVCVGGGTFTPVELESIEKYAKGRVHHIAWAENAVLASLYRGALALVFPSLYEGFGIPVAEAMACACPVIASNTSSIPQVAGSAALLLNTVDSNTLESALTEVQSPARRAEMIAAGLEQALKFSWHTCAAATLSIYTSLHSQNYS